MDASPYLDGRRRASIGRGARRLSSVAAYYGRYVPSGRGAPQRDERASGHLIYVQQGTVFAVGFDLTRLETVGAGGAGDRGRRRDFCRRRRATGGVVGGHARVCARHGHDAARPIDWLTRDGKTAVLRAAHADWGNPRFSPDGQKLAVEIFDGKQRDVWVYEWARDTLTQLTFDPGEDRYPVWTPDGGRLVFASDRAVAGVSQSVRRERRRHGRRHAADRQPSKPGAVVVAPERHIPRLQRPCAPQPPAT